MSNLNIQEIKRYDWYHTIELSNNCITKGRYDWRPYMNNLIQFIGSLHGKKVLDVGTGNGFFAFEFEKLGAVVTAIDIPNQSERDNNRIGVGNIKRGEKYNNYSFKDPFNIAKNALNSNVNKIEINLYEMTPENIGVHDFVFCNDVLLHLSDPIRALSVFRTVCSEKLIVGLPVIEPEKITVGMLMTPKRFFENIYRNFGCSLLRNHPISEYYGAEDMGCFWVPNVSCLKEMIRGAGFVDIESTLIKLKKEHNEGSTSQGTRGFVKGFIK